MSAPNSFLSVLAAGVTRTKWASPGPVRASTGWFGVIRESYAGAFQANVEVDAPRSILAFSAVYSCVSLISADIAKLSLRLMVRDFGNTWSDRTAVLPEAAPLLKPNRYQTRAQFIELWIICKLLYGNVYVLKERDARGLVTALYILDPERVTPLVATNGDVYYRISADHLSGLTSEVTAPAREIIHDRAATLWHPLIGVSPIYACGVSATQGRRIQSNSATFFQNMSRPSGMLSAPQTISDETAARLKREFEGAFSGAGLGRLFVAGDDLKYSAMTISAMDAQLIEQLRWTVEDIARAFRVPLHMLGAGPAPTLSSVQALEQAYYSRTLQFLIESFEQCLDAGLELKPWQRTEFDLADLLRMDSAAQYDALGKAVGGGWMAPNEAREKVNLAPVAGGATPYLQVQNYSLAALDQRDRAQGAPSTAGSGSGPGKNMRYEVAKALDELIEDMPPELRGPFLCAKDSRWMRKNLSQLGGE